MKNLTYLHDYTHSHVHTPKNNQDFPVQSLITPERLDKKGPSRGGVNLY